MAMKEATPLRVFNLSLRNCGKDRYIKKGNEFGPAISGDYIMQYCFAGCGVFEVEGKSYPVKKGECMVSFPGQLRCERADKDNPWRNMWLSFEGKNAKLFFEKLGVSKDNPVIQGFEQSKVPYLMQEIIDLSVSAEPGRDFLLPSKIYEFFNECLDAKKNENKSYDTKDIYVAHAINYIDMHFTESDISIEKIAGDIGIDRSYFYKLFKDSVGVSPKEYLTSLRIEKAKELLKMPNATVTNVAYSVGYEPSVFTKAFLSREGIAPSLYKESLISDIISL